MSFVLDRLYSATFPFETHVEGIPDSLFCDANIIGASACTVKSILIGGGVISVQAIVTTASGNVNVHSNAVTADADTKIYLYDDNNTDYGWVLTSRITPPEDLVLDDITAPLCSNTCCIYRRVTQLNETGMTGNWTIVGVNGVKIEHAVSDKTLTLTFDEDEEYFTVPSGDDVEYEKGIGICSICGVPGPTVTFEITDGKLYPVYEFQNSKKYLRDILIVPNLIFEYPYYDPSKGEEADPEVKNYETSSINIVSEDDIRWDGGAIKYTDGFTVNLGSSVFQGSVEMNKYIDGIYGPTLFISWIACDRTDYIRSVIKTSTEDGSDTPYPLDEILRDK